MPPPRMFAGLGLFVREGFLDAGACETLAAAMAAAPSAPAAVFGADEAQAVRRVLEIDVPPPVARRIDDAIAALVPDIEAHFGWPLGDVEPASFLRYATGGYYGPHRDRPPAAHDEGASRRRVSVVIFVNGGEGPAAYAGGRLRFYGLLGDTLEAVGLDLEPRPGTLVAFDAGLVHEVTPVTAGTRFSVATWARGAP